MTKDIFLVIQVEGICLNGNIDARNKSAGYINMLRSKQKMGPFFEWCDTKIVHLYFQRLLSNYSHIPVNYEGVLDKHMFARINVDSEMHQVARLSE